MWYDTPLFLKKSLAEIQVRYNDVSGDVDVVLPRFSEQKQDHRLKETNDMGGTRFIMAGSFIDGSGAAVRRNVVLTVKDTIITGIGCAADLPRHEGAVIDDLSHCTILPALVDCSVSLARSPSVDCSVRLSAEESGLAKMTTMLERHIRDCHSHGVLGAAACDDPILLQRSQGEMAQGTGIVIRASNSLERANHAGAPGDTTRYDFLRLGYSANIEDEESPSPRFSQAELCRMLQQRDGRNTVVVANGRQQVADALEVGCDAIEQGYGMGEDNIRKMAEKGVVWIPSVLRAKNGLDGAGSGGNVCCRFSQRYVAPGKPNPGAETFWKKILAEQLTQLRLARQSGVTTAVGTGAGSVGILHGESMVEEMKLFIKAGYTLEETIRCGSEHGARFFGMEQLGTLTVGRKATFLITRGTPKQLPRKLSYLEGIYVDGAPSITYHKNPVKMV